VLWFLTITKSDLKQKGWIFAVLNQSNDRQRTEPIQGYTSTNGRILPVLNQSNDGRNAALLESGRVELWSRKHNCTIHRFSFCQGRRLEIDINS
jgi:hypothetical protein